MQTEGLASDANPTPDNVMTWIEKQFSRKKEKKAAGEIRERLAQMVEHVGQAHARIVRSTAACSTKWIGSATRLPPGGHRPPGPHC